uniref:Putative replicase n=1 Tax=Barns Ness breadcrumb sponge hepe-like virus 1 TaxID=2021911 RepID=A0A221LFG7_9VIRU|nr:putative replicase [Barns Ness breadcrumb sponge hepe-like virus 1]
MSINPFYTGNRAGELASMDRGFVANAITSATSISATTVKCPIALTLAEYNWLKDALLPRELVLQNNSSTKHLAHRSHALAAFMTDYATKKFVQLAGKYHRAIDVGGGYDYTPAEGTHICARIVTDREKSRYTHSAVRHKNDGLFQTARGNNQLTVCHSGAEHCTYKAPYCYSVNSNYDMSLNTLADIFNIHQAVVYDVAMFLPSVLNSKKINIPSPVYNIKLVGNRVQFYFNDGSNGYCHDYNTWRSYLVINRIKCKDFDIVSEIVDNISDFFIIRFTRIEHPCVNESLFRVFDFANIYHKQYTVVPNIVKTLHGVVGNYSASYIVSETDFIHNAITYGLKLTKEAFAYPAFNTHCIAFSKSLIYGADNELVYQGITNKNESFNELVLNLFIYVAIRRCDVTQTIKTAFCQINKDQKRGFISQTWQKLKTTFKQSQSELLDSWFSTYENVDDVQQIEKIVSNLMRVRVVNLQHYMYENIPYCTKPFDAIKAEWSMNNEVEFNAESAFKAETTQIKTETDKITETEKNDTIVDNKVVKVPAVQHESTDTFGPGQCAYRALQCAMHATDKTALRFNPTPDERKKFLELSYHHRNLKEKNASALIKFDQDANSIRLLDAESTWLSLEEIFFIAYINGENCVVINRVQNSVSTFRLKEGDINLKICHDGVGHWFYTRFVGGYKTIISTTDQLLHTNLKVMETIFLLKEKTGDHMQQKMGELFDFIKVLGDGQSRVVDLTAAPGHLGVIFECSKQGARYHPYTIKDKLKIMSYRFTHEHKYYESLKEIVFESDDIIVVDLFIHEFHLMLDLLDKLKPTNRLIIKSDPYRDGGLMFPFNNFKFKQIFKMEHSLIQSGELYYHLSGFFKDLKPSNKIRHVDVNRINNVDHVIARSQVIEQRKDDLVAQESMIMKNFNTEVKFTVDEQSFTKFIADNKLSDLKKPDDFSLNCLNGMGGSRKTQRVVNVYKTGTDFIVSPIRSQADNLMPAGSKTKTDIYTYIVLLRNLHNNPKVVIRHLYIDECFAMQPSAIAYYYALLLAGRIRHIHLMGDSKQIGPYCKDNTTLQFELTNYVSETHRTPQDVTRMFDAYIPNARTSSKIVASYKQIDELRSQVVDIALAFTQDGKKFLASLGYKSMTVNESQGMTFSKVLLYLDDYCHIQAINKTESIRHVYVGASRHKDELLVYGKSSPDLQVLLTVQGAPIEEIIEEASIPLVTEQQIIVDDVKRPWRSYDPKTVTTKDSIIDVLCNLNVKKNFTHSADIRIEPLKLKKIDGTQMKISDSVLHPVDVSISGGKLSDQRFVLPYYSKDSFGTLNTQIARYATTRAGKAPDHYKNLQTGLGKFVDLAKFKNMRVDNERLTKHFVNYIVELQKKIKPATTDVGLVMSVPGVVKRSLVGASDGLCYDEKAMIDYYVLDENDEDLVLMPMTTLKSAVKSISSIVNRKNVVDMFEADLNNIKSRMITFTMKKQDKHDPSGLKETTGKAGQGVSAWSKVLNLFFCAYSRYLTECIFECMNENVLLAFNKSDAELSVFFAGYKDYYTSEKYVNCNCDFSEMDVSHTKSMLELELELFGLLGVNAKIINFYSSMRTKWCNLYQCREGITMLHGEYMQHSGQPLTICGNTLLNMAVLGYAYRIENMLYASFKGDDSTIRAKKISTVPGKKTAIYADHGYKLKISFEKVSEFIANFITPFGFFPDVVRRAVKAVSKVYEDEESWEESRINLKEVLSMVNSAEKFKIGVDCASIHYRDKGIAITAEQVSLLYQYLIQLSVTEYKDAQFIQTVNRLTYSDNYQSK